MDGARDDFLAGPRFAGEENGRFRRRDLGGLDENVAPALRGPHDSSEAAPRRQLFGESRHALFEGLGFRPRLGDPARLFRETLVRERKSDLVRDVLCERNVVLAVRVGRAREKEKAARELPLAFEKNWDPKERHDSVGREVAAPVRVGVDLRRDVANDLRRPVLPRLLGGRQPDRPGHRWKTAPRDGVDAHRRAILGEEPERHAVVRDDRPRDLRDRVENLADVEGPREDGGERLERLVAPAPVLLLGGEPCMRDGHRDDVRDRRQEPEVVALKSARLQADEREVADRPRAREERRAQHRPDAGTFELSVAREAGVARGGDVLDHAGLLEHVPQVRRVFGAGDEAGVRAPRLVRDLRAPDRVEDEPVPFVRQRDGHRVEREDAAGGRGDALEHDVEIQALAGDAGDLRKDRDECCRARLHGRAF